MTLIERLHPVSESVKVSKNLRAQAILEGPISTSSSDVPGSVYRITLNLVNRRGKVHASKVTQEDPSDFIFGGNQMSPDIVKSHGQRLLREVHPIKEKPTPNNP